VSLPSSYRSRRGHIHLPRVLPLVGCRSKTLTHTPHNGDAHVVLATAYYSACVSLILRMHGEIEYLLESVLSYEEILHPFLGYIRHSRLSGQEHPYSTWQKNLAIPSTFLLSKIGDASECYKCALDDNTRLCIYLPPLRHSQCRLYHKV
jgi:hypothetical protein